MDLIRKKGENIIKYFLRIRDEEGYKPLNSYQGIEVNTVIRFLKDVDRYSDDIKETVMCLLNDELPNAFPPIKTTHKICHGAANSHIGSYIGIIILGLNDKKDREGRDTWLKPLMEDRCGRTCYIKKKVFHHGHLLDQIILPIDWQKILLYSFKS